MFSLLIIGLFFIVISTPEIVFIPFVLFILFKDDFSKNNNKHTIDYGSNKKEQLCKSPVVTKRDSNTYGNNHNDNEGQAFIKQTASYSWNYEHKWYAQEDEENDEESDTIDEDDFWMDDETEFKLFDDDKDEEADGWWKDEYENNSDSDDMTYYFNGLGEPMTYWDSDGNMGGGPFGGI